MIFIAGYRWRERAEGGTYFRTTSKLRPLSMLKRQHFQAFFWRQAVLG